MTIIQADQILKQLTTLNERFDKLEGKVDGLTEALAEFSQQIEESVVRIEDASREPRDDY